MKKTFFIALVCCFFAQQPALAIHSEDNYENSTAVISIDLSGQSEKIFWRTDGYSAQGFKVVWSKSENPTYPLRSGDQYLYFADPEKSEAVIKPFAGSGIYYVRVCEYLGGKCGIYSNQIKVELVSDTQTVKKTKCAIEGQMTSGPVSPEYQFACCEGLESLNPFQDGRVGAGQLCYNPKRGTPSCIHGPKGEGWYYQDGAKLKLQSCGAVEEVKVACTMQYDPVCGKNGKTYSNKCMLNADKVEIDYPGECQKRPNEIPDNCILWNDGCNDCMVSEGKINGCTKRYCAWEGVAKCLKYKDERPNKVASKGLFRFAKYECYDGSREEMLKDNECLEVSQWREKAVSFCKQACSDDSGKCGVNQFAVWRDCSPDIVAIEDKADKLNNQRIEELLKELAVLRNRVKEQEDELKYLRKLTGKIDKLSEANQESIKSFVTYGVDDNTKKLGEGERAAVIHSYEAAYGKLPTEEAELADMIKIANGRFPAEINEQAELRAKERFVKIYLRQDLVDNANDQAAIKIMAYGLKQRAENRNLKSEAQGIKTFISIFNFHPNQAESNGWTGAEAWNTVQAITYSGAKR